MNRLEKMFKMNEKVAIFVPSTSDVNREIDNSKYVEQTLFTLSNLFGGATAVNTKGSYVADNGSLVVENTVMVYAYGTDIQSKMNEVLEYVEFLQIELNQECIGLEYNNSFYLYDYKALASINTQAV